MSSVTSSSGMQSILCLGPLWLSRPSSLRLVQASKPLRGYVLCLFWLYEEMTYRCQFVAEVDTKVNILLTSFSVELFDHLPSVICHSRFSLTCAGNRGAQ